MTGQGTKAESRLAFAQGHPGDDDAEPPAPPAAGAPRDYWSFIPILAVLVAGCALTAPALFTAKAWIPADLLRTHFLISPQEGGSGPAANPTLSDVLDQFYPYFHFLKEEVRSGRIPFWNPYVLGGTPFVANTVSAVFFPLNWALLLLPLDQAFEWAALLKMFIGIAGAFVLARTLGADPLSASITSASFVFSGYLVFFLLFPNTWVTALSGWTLVAVEWHLRKHPGAFSLLALLTGLAFLAGHIESAALLYMAAGLYGLLRRPARILQLGAALTTGLLLAALVIIPFVQLLGESATLAERGTYSRNPYYFPPLQVFGLLIPYLSGSPLNAPTVDLTGSPMAPDPKVFFGMVHFGPVPWILALSAVWTGFRRAEIRALAVVTLFSFCILFGVPPVFDLFTSFPLLRQGNHIHISQILLLCLAALAGIGLAQMKAEALPNKRLLILGFATLLLVLAGGLISNLPEINPDARAGSFPFLGARFGFPIYSVLALIQTGLFLGVASRPGWLRALVLPLILTPGLAFAWGLNPAVEVSATLPETPGYVSAIQAFPHERVAAVGTGFFPPNYPMRWEIRDIRGYESVVPETAAEQGRILGLTPDAHRFLAEVEPEDIPALRRSGVSLLVSTKVLDSPELTQVSASFPYVYRIQGAARVHWATPANPGAVPSAAHDFFRSGVPIDNVVIEDGDSYQTSVEDGDKQQMSVAEDSGNAPTDGILWKSDHPDSLELEVEAPFSRLLIVRDNLMQGWRAEVDGKPVPLLRADFFYRAVEVPSGRHAVRFEYRAPGFRLGLLLSGLSAGLIAVLAVLDLGGFKRFFRRLTVFRR